MSAPSAPSAPCTSIHMELHLEACQILQGGVCQAVSTQVQGGEALQVEQRSIERSQLVAAQVDHLQVQSIEKTRRQFFQRISTQVQQLQGIQIPRKPVQGLMLLGNPKQHRFTNGMAHYHTRETHSPHLVNL